MILDVGKRYLIKDNNGQYLEITVLEKVDFKYKVRNCINDAIGWVEIPDETLPESSVSDLGGVLNIATNKFVNISGVPQLTKKHDNDAGYDIASMVDEIIVAGTSKLISTGLYLEILPDFVGIVKSRSGLSVKNEIEVGAGVIDSNYRGELLVHLYNHGKEDFTINKGDRIAQLLIIPLCCTFFEEVESLSTTDRNTDGIGSTGK